MRINFTLNGVARSLSTEEVEDALRGREPERIFDYAVEVGGMWYPAKQAFVTPLGLVNRDVNSRTAYGHLSRLGFRAHDRRTDGPLPGEAETEGGELALGAGQREMALRLAVRLLAGTGATAADATATADAFSAWLAAR